MIPLYTQEEFDNAKVVDLLPCKCLNCGKTFYRKKQYLLEAIKGYEGNTAEFCSPACARMRQKASKIVECGWCGKSMNRPIHTLRRSISGKVFCSRSCSSRYSQAHKTKGANRSMLEIFLEHRFSEIDLGYELRFNAKTAIQAELDIYIPALNIAFEINGVFHYKPIFSQEKFDKTLLRDKFKKSECFNKDITLYILDVSNDKDFNELDGLRYFDYILNIILCSKKVIK